MDRISTYSSILINKLMETGEISYYELKKYFEKTKIHPNSKEVNVFNLENELDNLEEMGIVRQEEGIIVFQGL